MHQKEKIIVVTGPESSGKTWMANAMAEHYNYPIITEYAVDYLNENGLDYHAQDVYNIGDRQEALIAEYAERYDRFITDTDGLTIHIWLQEKYGLTYEFDIEDRLYLLCYPDIPWEYHAMRENPHDRLRLYHIHEQILLERNARFVKMEGSKEERMERIREILDI